MKTENLKMMYRQMNELAKNAMWLTEIAKKNKEKNNHEMAKYFQACSKQLMQMVRNLQERAENIATEMEKSEECNNAYHEFYMATLSWYNRIEQEITEI